MGAGSLTSWPTGEVKTKIAFCCFHDWGVSLLVDQKISIGLARLNHSNIVIRTRVRTGGATNASNVIDHHLTAALGAMNSPGGTTNHTNRINTMHARIRNNVVFMLSAMTHKPGITTMAISTGMNAFIASSTPIAINEHSRGSIDKAILHRKLNEICIG